jgi:hypothetical protein
MNLSKASVCGCFFGLVLASTAAAQEIAKSAQAPSEGWMMRFTAHAHPGFDSATKKFVEWPLRNSEGTELDKYRLSFESAHLFVVEGDRKFAFTHEGAFRHEARWKTKTGVAEDYLFDGHGTIVGKGQREVDRLKLKLEWKSGTGQGKSSGKDLTKPVADHTQSSEWELKLTKLRMRFGSAGWQEVPAYVGTRTTRMSQQLAGCPSLPLTERVEIYKSPSADLEVTIKDDLDPIPLDGKCVLTVSIKNLGPDPCPPSTLNVSLPPGVAVKSPKPVESARGVGSED